MFSNKNNQLPALCTESGTAPRKELLEAHLTSEMHRQCSALDLSETLPSDLKEAVSSQVQHKKTVKAVFTAQPAQVAVFNDAKRGTLSGWSWPSREVADMFGSEKSSALSKSVGILGNSCVLSNASLQYLVPSLHAELLECIIAADKQRVKDKMLNSMAVSLRADGSVDGTQIDNVHVMAKIVTSDGMEVRLFQCSGTAHSDNRHDWYRFLLQAIRT